jgi:hypothetical protein
MPQPTKKQVLNGLRRWRKLVANPKTWTRNAYARDSKRREVGALNPDAVRWCAYGGLIKVCGKSHGSLKDAMHRAVVDVSHMGLVVTNDGKNGRRAVLRLIDAAIAAQLGARVS